MFTLKSLGALALLLSLASASNDAAASLDQLFGRDAPATYMRPAKVSKRHGMTAKKEPKWGVMLSIRQTTCDAGDYKCVGVYGCCAIGTTCCTGSACCPDGHPCTSDGNDCEGTAECSTTGCPNGGECCSDGACADSTEICCTGGTCDLGEFCGFQNGTPICCDSPVGCNDGSGGSSGSGSGSSSSSSSSPAVFTSSSSVSGSTSSSTSFSFSSSSSSLPAVSTPVAGFTPVSPAPSAGSQQTAQSNNDGQGQAAGAQSTRVITLPAGGGATPMAGAGGQTAKAAEFGAPSFGMLAAAAIPVIGGFAFML